MAGAENDVRALLLRSKAGLEEELDRVRCDAAGVSKLNDFGTLCFRRLNKFHDCDVQFGDDNPSNASWARDAFGKDHTRFLRTIVTMQQLAYADVAVEAEDHPDKDIITAFAVMQAQKSKRPSGEDVEVIQPGLPTWKKNIASYSIAKIPRYQISSDERVVLGSNVADKHRLSKILDTN
jgi:hypothetical protein